MYQYYDLSPDEFENLVIAICKEILGLGTQGFAKGVDGGRDAKFCGVANIFPSQRSPWSGTTIIQAKHTTGINKHFGESDFYSPTSNTCKLALEIPKIIKLKESGELNNYLLFANRKLTGNLQPEIVNHIAEKTNIAASNIYVMGVDDLDSWLSRYSYIMDLPNVNLRPLMKAPAIRPDDLAEVIGQFSKVFDSNKMKSSLTTLERTTYKEKNELNCMRDDFSAELVRLYMKDVARVKEFLYDPQNKQLQKNYQEAINEFQLDFIIPKQRQLEYFDDVFNELVTLLVSRDHILNKQRSLTRLLVFYMYWNCDIGKSNDDTTKQA